MRRAYMCLCVCLLSEWCISEPRERRIHQKKMYLRNKFVTWLHWLNKKIYFPHAEHCQNSKTVTQNHSWLAFKAQWRACCYRDRDSDRDRDYGCIHDIGMVTVTVTILWNTYQQGLWRSHDLTKVWWQSQSRDDCTWRGRYNHVTLSLTIITTSWY